MIRKVRGKYHIYSKGGRKLTKRGYSTKAQAMKRLRQIEYFKRKGRK